ncbi:MAG TPA: transaldolase [Solirubrobacterales bacterium]
MNPTEQLHDLGQSLWLDNITRTMLGDGSLAGYIEELSVTGLTSNPTIFDKAITGGDAYDEQIAAAGSGAASPEEIFFELAIADLRAAADLFAAVHARSDGLDGWVSLEVSPLLADDVAATIEQAARLHGQAARDNLFVKIPGTEAGRAAIEESIFAGRAINVTLLFSREHYLGAADAYMRGLERRVEAGLDPAVPSVASLFVSRWDVAVMDSAPEELRDRLGIAIAGRTYRAYRELLDSERWQRLANEGARPQRLLFASTGTKDPEASDVLYIEALAAPFTIDTMPDVTLKAFADHGTVGEPLPADGGDAEEVLAEFGAAGIDVEALAARLQEEGKRSFADSWADLLKSIESERERLVER